MINKKVIGNLLSKMTSDLDKNVLEIKKNFGNLNYIDDEYQSILHILVDEKYDEDKCFLAIASLLKAGLDPNLKAYYNYNFIQTALYAGYSEKFVLKIINEALKYGLNVNHVDYDGDTIMHTAIYSDDYLGDIEAIYDLLCKNGFDSSIRDNEKRNLLEAMIFQNQYSKKQILSFERKFKERYSQAIERKKDNIERNNTIVKPVRKENNELLRKKVSEFAKYGILLYEKDYVSPPTIGRENELNNLIVTLAQEKKNPLIVGESGVGKTALVDELVYRIKIGQVPEFLKGKIVLGINPSDLVAGCRYVGQFEENMIKLMKLCEKYEVILFIDEIHTIYGVGATNSKNSDMSSILKHYIDSFNLKVIGATTEKEYNQFFSGDALKRRFEKIVVKEPKNDVLYKIINKVMEDYYLKNNISFENEEIKNKIVNIIVNATERKHRVYNDVVNNPDLSISIIDKAFAFAKVEDSQFVTAEHFIQSFECCDRIYEWTKDKVIAKLKTINSKIFKPRQKALALNFVNRKNN